MSLGLKLRPGASLECPRLIGVVKRIEAPEENRPPGLRIVSQAGVGEPGYFAMGRQNGPAGAIPRERSTRVRFPIDDHGAERDHLPCHGVIREGWLLNQWARLERGTAARRCRHSRSCQDRA